MKKRIVLIIVAMSLMAAFAPLVSRAAMTPYFMAVNDTLQPFGDDTMPLVVDGAIYVPPAMLSGVSVWSVASEDYERVVLYRGPSKRVELYTASGITHDQSGNTLPWPAARKIGSRFYVPLDQVCEFFDLTYDIIDISRDIVPDAQMRIIRIKSGEKFNDRTFVGLNGSAIRSAYNEYYAPPPPPPQETASPGEPEPDPPVEEPPPTYGDVTIFLSFYNTCAGGADVLLGLIGNYPAHSLQFCFFINERDIIGNPALIRRISGSGHTVGIWLEEGTLQEYLKASELLFEAAKIKTIIVTADEATGAAREMADANGLIFWGTSQSLVYNDTLSVDDVTAMIPKESGARLSLMSSCDESATRMLPGILAFLRENEYTTARITETVPPLS